MNHQENIHHEELFNSIALLKEYTNKLRKLCYSKMTADSKVKIFIFTISLIFFSITAWFIEPQLSYGSTKIMENNKIMAPLFISFFGVAAFIIFIKIATQLSSNKSKLEADELASILSRLIKMCSQYQEHSSYKLGLDMEFNLRLAEAESILSMYTMIFSKKKNRWLRLFFPYIN